MKRTLAALVLIAATAGCGGKDSKLCLPTGEKGIVLRSGTTEGYRFVTLKRANGEEVTCTGKNTPTLMQPGDEVDGWTLTRAHAGKD